VSTGIRIWGDGKKYEDFLPWPKLKIELDRKLLPQLFADPSGFGFQVFDHHGKPDWVVKLVRSDGTGFCYLWLGGDPGRGWQWDGLIRLGAAEPAQVWQIYQRYSDGTYRRLASAFRRLEDVGWNGTV
jgi:hypothetical protein